MNLNIQSTVIIDSGNAVITTIVPAAKLGQLQAIIGNSDTVEVFAESLVSNAAQSLIDGAIANARVNAAAQAQAQIEAALAAG
jgi:hypothetical protein